MTTMTTQASDPTVSTIILRQLGGHRFLAMTGARDLCYDNNSLTMRLPKAKDRIRYVKIALTDADLYEVTGFDKSGKELPAAKRDDIYNDQLQAAFESLTGLYVTL